MNRKQTVIISCIALFAACLPLFTVNCIGGHDIAYHLLRIESLKTGIQNGLPFLRVNMLFFNGQGYASSLFYPDLFLYIPALLRVAGVGINASCHIFIAFCIIAGFLTAYYAVKSIVSDDTAALIFAVMFSLFKYHLFDIYTRGAVGEFTALIFLPLVIAGLYDLKYGDLKKPWLLVTGMAGVVLTHTITAFFCALLCLAVFLTGIRAFIRSRDRVLRLLFSVAAVILLTAFYIFPMFEMMGSMEFSLSKASFDLNNEKLLLKDIFLFSEPSMGIVVFIPLILRVFIKKEKDDSLLSFADLLAVLGLAACLCTTGLLPWDRLMVYFSQIQFPWRLFVIAGPLIVFADAVYITVMIREGRVKDKAAVFCLLAGMMISALWGFENNDQEYYSYSDDYYEYAPFTAEVIGGEWLPAAAGDRDELIASADIAIDSMSDEIRVVRKKNTLTVSDINPEAKYVDVPFVYYKGYAARDEKGRKLAVDGKGDNGRVRVYTDKAASVRVYYEGTLVQHISTAVTLLFIAGILVYIFIRKKRKT